MDTLFFLLSKTVWLLIRPESILIGVLCLSVVFLFRGWTIAARRVLGFSVLTTLVIALFPVDHLVYAPLEQAYPVPEVTAPAGLIILGGAEHEAPHYANRIAQVNDAGERLIAAMSLAQKYPEVKVLYSGGKFAINPVTPGSFEIGPDLLRSLGLEEERLIAEAQNEILTVTRQTLGEKPDPVEMTSPSGSTFSMEFEKLGEGVWRAEQPVDEIGLYRAVNDELSTLVQVGPANPRELAAVVSTTETMTPITNATSGSISRFADNGVPRFVPVSENATKSGRGWAGLVNTNSSVLNGVFRIPLFTGLLGLAILLLGFSAMWFREGR